MSELGKLSLAAERRIPLMRSGTLIDLSSGSGFSGSFNGHVIPECVEQSDHEG
ncbi:MAG: hypothetical protein WAL29_09265 [Bacteroidales bacterium]